jgi:DNA modification methylase
LGGDYPQTKLARPTDIWYITVGGGHMGPKLSHKHSAIYPEKLVLPFIKVLTNPGDSVLDPFCGSGTTLAVAGRLGRNWVGVDNDPFSVKLSQERVRI